MKLLDWLTGRRSARAKAEHSGKDSRFSRACGDVVPLRVTGLPSPNSKAAEQVRRFLVSREHVGRNLRALAVLAGRDPQRYYREHEGSAVLSWDLLDQKGGELGLEDRLVLGRFLMDRWGLRVEVGPLPGIEV